MMIMALRSIPIEWQQNKSLHSFWSADKLWVHFILDSTECLQIHCIPPLFERDILLLIACEFPKSFAVNACVHDWAHGESVEVTLNSQFLFQPKEQISSLLHGLKRTEISENKAKKNLCRNWLHWRCTFPSILLELSRKTAETESAMLDLRHCAIKFGLVWASTQHSWSAAKAVDFLLWHCHFSCSSAVSNTETHHDLFS